MTIITATSRLIVHTTVPQNDELNCAQALRPTFDGWGPKIR
jgi:hypothetical protein